VRNAGDHDDPDARVSVQDRVGRVGAVQARHLRVHDDDVRLEPVGELDRGVAVAARPDDRVDRLEVEDFGEDLTASSPATPTVTSTIVTWSSRSCSPSDIRRRTRPSVPTAG
jgi:hypothetical protein